MTRPAASRQAVPTDGPPLAAWRPRVVAVAVPMAAVGTHALLYGGWIVDDAPRHRACQHEIMTSPAGVTDWVRRDAVGPGDLDALRARAAEAAVVDAYARRSPRASCGDVLVPSA